MTGRNDKCPCGSGQKYKRCYGNGDLNCSLYMRDNRKEYISQHTAREKEVVDFLMSVIAECDTVFFKNEKEITPIPQRIQMIVIFSLIDVLGSYWFSYLNDTGTTNERPRVWYEEFCINTENQYYKGLFTEVSSERLYKFRNALVHFFGLGEPTEDIFIALAANDLSDENKKNMEAEFARRKHKTIMLRPSDFFGLVREGTILMMFRWSKVIEEAQHNHEREKEHIDGVERVWKKIRNEGAKGMSREQAGLPS